MAKVKLPVQSMLEGVRVPLSRSFQYDQKVPSKLTGTDTRKTSRHSMGAKTPPITSPMKEPPIAATPLMPRASPRSLAGKASVRIALELANKNAPPTPWPTRMAIIHIAPLVPVNQVTDSRMEKTVKMANPRVNIRTRPKMSPTRPKLTTSTEVTNKKPVRIHKKYGVLDGAKGLRWMPRKILGNAMSRIEPLIVASRMPRVVLDRAIHL